MDDKREGRPSFKTSDVVRDVIDGDRRLTVKLRTSALYQRQRYMKF
jgi:hypothetical protein